MSSKDKDKKSKSSSSSSKKDKDSKSSSSKDDKKKSSKSSSSSSSKASPQVGRKTSDSPATPKREKESSSSSSSSSSSTSGAAAPAPAPAEPVKAPKPAKSKDDEVVGITIPPVIGYEDMTKMEDMTLDGVLSNLEERYARDLIYVRLLLYYCRDRSLSLSSNLYLAADSLPPCRPTRARFSSPSIPTNDCPSTARSGFVTTRASASACSRHTCTPSLRLLSRR